MDKEKIAAKIEELQQAQQKRLQVLASSDPEWAALQGQIVAWNEMLGKMKEKAEKTY
jgi:hypothetical protein